MKLKCERCFIIINDHWINIIWYYFHKYILRDIEVLCNACYYDDI